MVDYNIVIYCRLCKKRMVIKNGMQRVNYCEDCQKKFRSSEEKK